MFEESDLRRLALAYAVESFEAEEPDTDKIIERATAFFNFLKGDKDV